MNPTRRELVGARKSQEEEQEKMTGGYVALLDVLGFASLVAGEKSSERLETYLSCLSESGHSAGSGVNLETIVFSDSIVVTAPGYEVSSITALVRRCSKLLGLMLSKQIAIRGAIACGSYDRTSLDAGVFVAGRAIIDAFRFEKIQDWIGIMLAPFVQPCRKIPFHNANPSEDSDYEGFAIVPTSGDSDPKEVVKSLDTSLAKLQWMKALAPDPAAQAKYTKTNAWLSEVQGKWKQVVRFAEIAQERK